MPAMPIGDLALNFMQRSASNRINRNLVTLSAELTTGMKQDVSKAVGGHTAPVAAIERTLTRLDAQTFAATEAQIFTDATGTTLSSISSRVARVSGEVMAAGGNATAAQIDILAVAGRTAFAGMISDLSMQVGGRPLFAGTSGGGPATSSADVILGDLVEELRGAGATSADDIANGVAAYFAEGGSFDDHYLGATTDLAPFDLGGGHRINAAVRADDPVIREGLIAVARVAVLGEALPLTSSVRAQALSESVVGLLQGQEAVIGLEARTGTAAASIEDETVRIASERSGLESARLGLLSADPFETASRLRQTETQLEALHTLTARLSRLNLTSFLR